MKSQDRRRRPEWRYGVVLGLVLSSLIASCGEGNSSGQNAPDLGRLGLTRALPTKLVEACQQMQRQVEVTVYCPPVVPRTIPPPLQVQTAGPLLRIDRHTGSRYFRRAYEANFSSGSWLDPGSGGHWLFSGGSPRAIQLRVGPQSLAPHGGRLPSVLNSRKEEIAGTVAAVKRMAPYPQGGISGGHVLVLWTSGANDYYVSVHGYENERRALAMAEALIREIQACPVTRGPVISDC